MKIAACLSLLLATPALAGDIRGRVTGVPDPQNVVVYVEKVPGKFPITTTPIMDQRNMAFAPHVLPILNGSKVNFPNSDLVRHSVYSTSKAMSFNLGLYGMGDTKDVMFKLTTVPAEIHLQCSIHSQLSGFIYVLQNPYFTTPNPDGTYEITGVPAGTYTLSTWHEGGAISSKPVTVGATAATADFVIQAK